MTGLAMALENFNGKKLCDMSQEELEFFLGAIAERGANNALARIGLHDENAVNDVRDLRELLSGFRVVKKVGAAGFLTLSKDFIKVAGKVLVWIIVIYGMMATIGNDRTKAIINIIHPAG